MAISILLTQDVIYFKDFLVHDEANKCKEGDVVRIEYVRPLSARKTFAVTEILSNKGQSWIKYRDEVPAKVASEELQKLRQYQSDREQRIKGHGNVVEDLRRIESLAVGDSKAVKDADRIKQLMNKYQITSWPPTEQVVSLEFQQLKDQLRRLNITIGQAGFSSYSRDLLVTNPEKADEILRSMNKDPSNLSANVKKNLLMKFFARSFIDSSVSPDEIVQESR